jgi:REP element-mobilizing transposase RayT
LRLVATRHSHAELFVHVVWATKERVAVLDRALRNRLRAQAVETAHALGASVLAFGGASDHVHVLLRYRPDLPASSLVRGIKAALTRSIRRDGTDCPDFSWQAGYGAFSVGASELERVVAYIANQERHHADGAIWPEWDLED